MTENQLPVSVRASLTATVLMLILMIFIQSAAALSNSGGGTWPYSREITITNPDAALSDYQVIVSLSGGNFPAGAQDDGDDVRFTDAGGTELSYWIESWDYAGKSAKVWVKVPGIPAGGSAAVRMWYGNPGAISASNITEVALNHAGASFNNPNSWNIMSNFSGIWTTTTIGTRNQKSNVKTSDGSGCALYFPSSNFSVSGQYVIEASMIPYQAGARTGIITISTSANYGFPGYRFFNQKRWWDNGFSFLNDHIAWISQTSAANYAGIRTHYRVINNAGHWTAGFWNEGATESYQINSIYYATPNAFGQTTGYTGISCAYDDGTVGLHDSPVELFYIFVRKYASPEPSVRVSDESFRFVQLTDVHVGRDPNCYDPRRVYNDSERSTCLATSYSESIIIFKKAINDILTLPIKPDFVLITGDIVEWNQRYQYETIDQIIKNEFENNNINVFTVPGNHDRRGSEDPTEYTPDFRGIYLPPDNLSNYRIYMNNRDKSEKIFDYNGYRFIGLDSGSDPGETDSSMIYFKPTGSGLNITQINLINNNSINHKTIVFMHHPAIDDDTLNVIKENREQFIEEVKYKGVSLVLTGHTHRKRFFDSYDHNLTNNHRRNFERPLYIQTRSTTKNDSGYLRGYLIVDITKDGEVITDRTENYFDKTSSISLTIKSPADLHVVDEFGRHTGLNASGFIETSIPDSYYFKEEKVGNLTLPAFVLLFNTTLNYSYKIISNFSKENITGDTSNVTFTIMQQKKDITTTINYANVNINRNSTAYMQMNATQINYTMFIDLNNDSITDSMKIPDSIKTDRAPAAIILSPSNNSTWNQGQQITFSGAGKDSEDGALNNTIWISDKDSEIGNGNFTTANLSAGVHSITMLVTDSAGQVNTSSIIITVNDTAPPVLEIEYPPDNKTFNRQNITVSGIAYDDSGISNVTVNGILAGRENWNAIIELNEGENRIEIVAIDNSGFNTTANRTVYYSSSLAADTQPPAAITNLNYTTGFDEARRPWINWTWDNPKDEDFGYAIIYLDNIRMENTSGSYFNITGLSGGANYTITILTADILDNINQTPSSQTVRTLHPPAIIVFPGMTAPPTDPDGDGIFEDINGNGRKDFNDVVLFFNNLEWVPGNEPLTAFDFNGNDRIDFADIVRLFEEV